MHRQKGCDATCEKRMRNGEEVGKSRKRDRGEERRGEGGREEGRREGKKRLLLNEVIRGMK